MDLVSVVSGCDQTFLAEKCRDQLLPQAARGPGYQNDARHTVFRPAALLAIVD